MQSIHGREQKDRKCDSEDVSGRLERSSGDGPKNGYESNQVTDIDSSWGDLSREEGCFGGQTNDGGILRQLKAIKKSLLAQAENNRQILEDGLLKNEQYKREVLSSIDSLENQITNLLGDTEDAS